jgi:hypothetical protein
MNIINDRELALRFKNGTVPSKERFIYLIIFILISESSLFDRYIFDDNRHDFDIYGDTLMILITIVGTIVCYITNKGGDDKEFVERYVGIGFSVTVRATIFLILFVVVSIVFYVIASTAFFFFRISQNFGFSSETLMDAWGSVMGACAMVYFFLRLNASIKLAASAA